jgi:ketol-acid reductoisomerase
VRASVYREADLELVRSSRVAVIGYGNQGSAQALNLRDSGVRQLRVGNRDDHYRERARRDGFEPLPIPEAAAWGQVVLLLIPDEEQPAVFREQVAPGLRPGDTLVVASGYNVAFGLLDIPDGVDVAMVAPRMIGSGVRERYRRGEPVPCFVSAERDSSGATLALALSLAKGIGAIREGGAGAAVDSSAREEAALDLFSEQAVWPAIIGTFRAAYTVLRQAGFSDDAILNELYLSKEPAEVFERAAEQGLFGQLGLHSHTSQFGQLRALAADDGAWLEERFRRVLHDDILSGRFAREWSAEQAAGADRLERLRADAEASPLGRADRAVRAPGPGDQGRAPRT